MTRLLPCLLLCGVIVFAQDRPQPDPDKARIVVTDIQNFWRAYDQSTEATRAEVMQREYLDLGSAGLQKGGNRRHSEYPRLQQVPGR